MLIKLKIAQSTAEYAILLALVVAAAMGIQNEVRKAIQSRIHDAAMELSGGKTYEPTFGSKTTSNQKSEVTKVENFVDANNNKPYLTIDTNSSADITSDMTQ